MDKNVRLADIYIKIYNKRPLTLEDLTFLAKFDRECFEKTFIIFRKQKSFWRRNCRMPHRFVSQPESLLKRNFLCIQSKSLPYRRF